MERDIMRRGAVAIIILATVLRILRAVCRWDEWALHYSAYNLPTYEAMQSDDWIGLLTHWVGLHPPLYPLLHSAGSIVWPSPATWLLFSSLCSLGAVCFMLAAHPKTLLPALLLATDPVQLHYAAEVNNYPLSVLLISAGWWGFQTNRPHAIAIAGCLAAWTHIMAGVAIFGIAICHPKRFRIMGVLALTSLPLLATAWGLAADAGSQRQPPLLLEASMSDAIDRFSVAWVILFPILLLGFIRDRSAAVGWTLCASFWVFTVALGIAAPHQFPYATILGVFAASLLYAATIQRPILGAFVLLTALVRGAWVGGNDTARAVNIYLDQAQRRGIDAVLELTLPGDAIVLVRGSGKPDDDRRHTSPTLWRFSPFEPMLPLSTGIRPDLAGQPRMVRGRRLYTFGHPREAIGTIPGAHVFTVLYDGAEQNIERIPSHPLQGEWQSAGPDLWRGPATTVQDSAEAVEPTGEETDGLPPGPPDPD
jgi:hypothetical protein